MTRLNQRGPSSAALCLTGLLLACEAGPTGHGEAGPTWHGDIAPIVEARCAGCHGGGDLAPFPLETYDQALALKDQMADAVASRRMPPWGAVAGHRDYLDDPSLSEEQIELFVAWAENGDLGDPDAPGQALPAIGASLDRIDLDLEMPEPYTLQNTPNDYRCFILDWPEAETTYVTGVEVYPGNGQIVHHLATYLFSPDTLLGDSIFETLEAWDESDEGPGYSCYGGPSGSTSVQVPIQQLAGWLPGIGAAPFAEGTGIAVPPGSKVVLQLHYYSNKEDPDPDQTRISFRLEDEVDHRAGVVPVFDINWPLGDMHIPAGDDSVTHSVQQDPRGLFGLVMNNLDFDAGFRVHAVLLHMHRLGVTGLASLESSTGSEVFVEVDPFNSDWQLVYHFAEPSLFEEGMEVHLQCEWDNSNANQPDGAEAQDVSWGEGANDEMCVANLYVSEF